MAGKKTRDEVSFLRLRRSRPQFAETSSPLPSQLAEYLDYYRLPLAEEGRYYFGYLDVGAYTCAAHLSIPDGRPKGTVVLVHGFLSHFGFYQDLIPRLVEEGWAVAGIDLPGHGLSTGVPTAIDDFARYGEAVAVLTGAIAPLAPAPFEAVGHSMGCAALLEYRRQGGELFERYLFVAPLVRSTMFGLSQFGFSIVRPFVDKLPRVYQKTTGDARYLEFKEYHDPLQTDQVDPSWVRALYSWNEEIEKHPPAPFDLRIVQGDLDRVVDFRYNLEFLLDAVPGSEIVMIPGARHEIPKEEPEMKRQLTEMMLEYFDE